MNIERRIYVVTDCLTFSIIFACIIQIRKCSVYNLNFDERHKRRQTVAKVTDPLCNALVICNHARPPSPGRAGDSRGNERGFDKSFATTVRGKYLGFALYRPKGQ